MSQLAGEDCARALFEALDGQHALSAAVFLDDVSLLHISGDSGLAGDYQGREAIVELFGRLARLTGRTLRCGAPTSTTRAGGTIVAQGPLLAERHGRKLATTVEVAVDVDEGVVREVWISDLHEPAFDDFWS
jgi:hypothetical protein